MLFSIGSSSGPTMAMMAVVHGIFFPNVPIEVKSNLNKCFIYSGGGQYVDDLSDWWKDMAILNLFSAALNENIAEENEPVCIVVTEKVSKYEFHS